MSANASQKEPVVAIGVENTKNELLKARDDDDLSVRMQHVFFKTASSRLYCIASVLPLSLLRFSLPFDADDQTS